MKLSNLLYSAAVVFVSLCVYAHAEEDDKKQKLQIGVKKRVDPDQCKIKSRKGDVLSMHYTVSSFWCFIVTFGYFLGMKMSVKICFTWHSQHKLCYYASFKSKKKM